MALYRSWVLTRRARRRTLGLGTLVTAAAILFFWLALYALAPLHHFAGLGMLWLSDDNVWITGVLMKVLPTGRRLYGARGSRPMAPHSPDGVAN
ncbi:hypothetical protein [Streptomyces sp. NPDC050264]|uniref:hypothetical protein n=1 Tax=Streptomyces sp. NPDC050264 TaxID=3155038 RepID=UPI00341BCCCA